ncbi:MAG: ABC transporter substrate-binding protein, partial [Myxococcales bacterium]|nr:ABC transporter substrate-binding protein [Myxococcales bacterium]
GGYGTRMVSAFSAAARESGLSIVFSTRYDRGQTTFAKEARVLAAQRFDALFVPDLARRLALLAPALAQAGLWSSGARRRAPKGRRAVQILATADGANAALIARAGRYLGGALLAPGFYPDDRAPGSGALVRIYRQTHGRVPGLLEAFAFDAVGVLRSHLERGVSTPAALLSALHGHAARGLTGAIKFDRAGARVGDVALYEVNGGAIALVP